MIINGIIFIVIQGAVYPPPQRQKLIPVPSNIHEVWKWFCPSRLLGEIAYPVPFQDFFAHLHDAEWTKVEGEGSCRLTSKDPISVCAKSGSAF